MIAMLFNAFLVVATFLFMEFMAWFTHKYIMHGFMWRWHASHHTHRKGFFEKNDLFAVVFSLPAIALIVLGAELPEYRFLLYIGLGITAYGLFYLIFHDIIVHRRLPIRFVARSAYMKRIMNAHYEHHKVHTKQGARAFGFLWAPAKYAVKEKAAQQTASDVKE